MVHLIMFSLRILSIVPQQHLIYLIMEYNIGKGKDVA